MINYITDDQLIINVFFVFLSAYIINPLLFDEVYISDKVEISKDSIISSHKNHNIEKFNFDSKDIIKNINNVINTNFELLDIYMMNNVQILDWTIRANNLILRLNHINSQNIIMLMHNNYDVLINQGELLLGNDPNTNPIFTQRLRDEIQKLRTKLLIMNAFKSIIKSAMWVGCFYYLGNVINNLSIRYQNMNQVAGDIRNIGDRAVERNFSNLKENRSLMFFLSYFSLHGLYILIKRLPWFRRGGK